MCFLSKGADLVRTPFFTLPPKAKGALLEKPSKNTRYRNWNGPIILSPAKIFPAFSTIKIAHTRYYIVTPKSIYAKINIKV